MRNCLFKFVCSYDLNLLRIIVFLFDFWFLCLHCWQECTYLEHLQTFLEACVNFYIRAFLCLESFQTSQTKKSLLALTKLSQFLFRNLHWPKNTVVPLRKPLFKTPQAFGTPTLTKVLLCKAFVYQRKSWSWTKKNILFIPLSKKKH